MVYSLALQVPEVPIKEEWVWTTDTQTSYDGTEDSAPLNRYPKRRFSGQYVFSTAEDIRRHMAFMFKQFKNTFKVPLYQYQVKLKQKVTAGSDTIVVNTLRSDFRDGCLVLIAEGSKFEEAIVESFDSTTLTFTEGLDNAYSARAIVCPVIEAYSDNGQSFTRKNYDVEANASFLYNEVAPWLPFVSPLNTATLTTFDSLVVLDQQSSGIEYGFMLDTGLIATQYIGLPDVFSPRNQSQWSFNANFQVNRVFDLDSWLWWFVFADHIQGSSTVFLIPSYREDLEVVTPAVGSGTQVTVTGHEYNDHYWGLDTFSRIVISSDSGSHYAKITGVASVGGNDRLTFTPALPAGAGWDQNQKIGFLLKVRSADDKIVCNHNPLHTDVSMALRTVA